MITQRRATSRMAARKGRSAMGTVVALAAAGLLATVLAGPAAGVASAAPPSTSTSTPTPDANTSTSPSTSTTSTTSTTSAPASPPPVTAPPAVATPAPGIAQVADPVAGEYIVTLAGVRPSSVRSVAADLVDEHDGDVLFTYKTALRGFAAAMSEQDAVALSRDPRVAAVEENGAIHLDATQTPTPSWGLDRLDSTGLDDVYQYSTTGAGVTAYIIDTGIRITHHDFGGRASTGADFVDDGHEGRDCNGHGTHVAGTVGGTTYGVAKAVRLVAVRIFDCSGSATTAQEIAAYDWVTANHSGPSVANGSFGGAPSAAAEAALRSSIASGVTYVVAAGNDYYMDACTQSPARVSEAVTVGATRWDDARADFSNVGPCVDLFAPGENISSASNGDDDDGKQLSGTSMATPHGTGAAALYLEDHPDATPAQVQSALSDHALVGRVGDAGPGPNRLLNTSFLLGGRITVVQDSVADSPQDFAFTATCASGPCDAFSLDDDHDPTLSRQHVGSQVPAGTYTITQAAVAGWPLASVSCDTGETVNLAQRRVTIDLAAGEAVHCTFTNRAPSITIVEDALPDSSSDFAFTGCQGAGCGSFALDDDTDPTLGRSTTAANLAPGTYVVTQSASPNWSLTSLVCDTGEVVDLAHRRATITLAAGEHTTCTFTDESASITIVQQTAPDNAQDFAYSGCAGAACGPFVLDDDSNGAHGHTLVAAGLAPGTYTVTQAVTSGWDLFGLACDTGEAVDLVARRATITLTAAEHVTCTFSNRVGNDPFATPQMLAGPTGGITSYTGNATREPGEPNHAGYEGGHSIWFRWTAPASALTRFDTCDSSFDTLLGVYRGAAVNGLTSIAANDDAWFCGSGGTPLSNSAVWFNATAGVTYQIAVDGWEGESGGVTLHWQQG